MKLFLLLIKLLFTLLLWQVMTVLIFAVIAKLTGYVMSYPEFMIGMMISFGIWFVINRRYFIEEV